MALLLDIRAYVADRKSASLSDIANRFRTDPEALRGMLAHWVAKGVMRRVDFGADCGGCKPTSACGSCGTAAAFETYEWVGQGA